MSECFLAVTSNTDGSSDSMTGLVICACWSITYWESRVIWWAKPLLVWKSEVAWADCFMTTLRYKCNSKVRIKLRKEVKPLFTWLCAWLAHHELLLDQGLRIRWSISFLFGSVLCHVTVGAGEEFGGVLLHIRIGLLSLKASKFSRGYEQFEFKLMCRSISLPVGIPVNR